MTDIELLSASEALYGFAAWVTCRKEAVTAGATHDAAVWAELVDEFCRVNGLAEPKDDWTDRLTMPDVSAAEEGQRE